MSQEVVVAVAPSLAGVPVGEARTNFAVIQARASVHGARHEVPPRSWRHGL
jgi:hypothetical protein